MSGCGLTGRSSQVGPPDGPPGPTAATGPAGTGTAATSPLPDVAAVVADSGAVPFTAEYKPVRSDGKVEPWTIVLIHQGTVVVASRQSTTGAYTQIWSPTDTYTCAVGGEAGAGKCERKGPIDAVTTNPESWAVALHEDVLGAQLLDPFAALHDLEHTIVANRPEVIRATRTYADQHANCVKTVAKGLDSTRVENEACFTARGIVAFVNIGLFRKEEGGAYSFDLIRYAESVDPARLKPPAAAEIVEA
jgi:hypothetical protein